MNEWIFALIFIFIRILIYKLILNSLSFIQYFINRLFGSFWTQEKDQVVESQSNTHSWGNTTRNRPGGTAGQNVSVEN
jgi:hypothetical protein